MEYLSTTYEYFLKGGFVMWPLLLCSLTAVAIGIERYISYKKILGCENFADEYCLSLVEGNYVKAMELVSCSKGACVEIISKMPNILDKTQLEMYFESRSMIVIAKLRQRLNYLNVIITLAPLLGLLGTIIGMITAFSVFNLHSGAPFAITGGIGEALIATATGLCVAIISLLIHAKFEADMDKAITNMEQCFTYTIEAKLRGL